MVAAVQRNLEDGCHAMLWLVAYSFLLRLPSEVSFLGLLLSIEPWYHLAYARHFPCASAHLIRQMPLVSRPSFGSTRTRYVCGCYDAKIARMGAV